MPRAGFLLLAEKPGHEIVFSQISRPWKVSAATGGTPALGPEEFARFDVPGYAKIAFNIRVEPYGSGRTCVTTETRTATTDLASRRRFGVYWRPIGPFSGLIGRLTLRLVKSDAESQPRTKGPGCDERRSCSSTMKAAPCAGPSTSRCEVGAVGMSEMRTRGVRICLLCVDAVVAMMAIGGDGPSEA